MPLRIGLNGFPQSPLPRVLESAVRMLSEFKKDGYIELKGREITILDADALLKTSGFEN